MPTPLVDVLIPVYNAEETAVEAIGTIQAQTVRDIRIILINDGSTDATPGILRGIASTDDRVLVIDRPNGGIVAALNTGLEACTAPFTARHDADDLAHPDRFEKQLAYLRAHPDCVAVSAFARHIDYSGVPTGTIAQFFPPDMADKRHVPCREPYLLHPFLMVRHEALAALGGYRNVHLSEDADLYWRLAERGRLHNIEEVMGSYRFTPQSLTSRSALNGRIGAVNSQLAAISALRRERGEPDLVFDVRTVEEMKAAETSRGILAVGRRGLTPDEARYLDLAYAAKMLELTSYKPYDLDLEDCRFVAEALDRHEGLMSAENRKEVRRQRAVASARLLRTGKFAAFAALVRPTVALQTLWRFGLQVAERALPASLRRSILAFRAARANLRSA